MMPPMAQMAAKVPDMEEKEVLVMTLYPPVQPEVLVGAMGGHSGMPMGFSGREVRVNDRFEIELWERRWIEKGKSRG